MVRFYTYKQTKNYKYLALLFLKWSLAPNAAIVISTCFLWCMILNKPYEQCEAQTKATYKTCGGQSGPNSV